MSTPADDFALLIPAATAVDAELAKELLESEGIPVLIHGFDRDFAELGGAVHLQVSRPDVYVPKTALASAFEILRRTWADFALPE